MKVALLGDVHANLPALEAVLDHAGGRSVEAVWNIGDLVGYGAFPDQVVRRLRDEGALSIIGNYDLKVLKVREKKGQWRSKKPPEKWVAFDWAYENLSEESRQYLASLPREIRLEVQGRRVLLTHGSPASNEEHLYPGTSDQRLRELARLARADVIICGHSHQAFVRKIDGAWFINTGSVGRSDDGDPRACYGILEPGADDLRVEHYRVEYDVERAAAEIRRLGLPEEFARMVLQGRSLDAVLKDPPAPAPPEEPALDEERCLRSATRLAEDCNYETGHTKQVTRLAMQLFDELSSVHGLGPRERFWLHCAAILHDIGWAEGRRGHHKTSLRIILESPGLPFNERQRRIVGCVARYHRRCLPQDGHQPFGALSPADKDVVRALSAILRVADGLDCDHLEAVSSLSCRVSPDEVVLRCQARFRAEAERQKALDKGDLFEQVFRRKLVIEWRLS